jgi:hypothetical protein
VAGCQQYVGPCAIGFASSYSPYADPRGLVVDFYNQINLLYGAITEFCSPQSCPEMKATDEYVGTRHCRYQGAHADGPDLNTCGRTRRTTSGRPKCRRPHTSSS